MPFFSVIIPTFNRASLLRSTLESVWAQGFTDYEIIVIDDGSKDGTQEYLSSLENEIVCLSQSNQGPGAARNLGARYAKGEYLAFLDSDDLWFPWSLEIYAEVIGQHNGPAIVGARLVEFAAKSELIVMQETALKTDAFADYFASHQNRYFVGAGMSVIRRDEFLKIGGYTTQRINAEDHDLILRMGNARGFVQMKSPVTLGWRRHKNSQTANLHDTLKGVHYMIQEEIRGAYPGGSSRAWDRRNIITSHTRPVTLDCLQQGLQREAWALYRATFAWNAALGRVKYLAAFPLLTAKSKFRMSKISGLQSVVRG